jgi:hypothetical protein
MATPTTDIPRDQWLSYFNELGRTYQGWGATVEVMGKSLGDQTVAKAEDVPFQGLSYEAKGGSAAGDILVEVGDANTAYDVHRVTRPRAVRTTQTDRGEEFDVEVESEDGTICLIHLRPRPDLPPSGQPTMQPGMR